MRRARAHCLVGLVGLVGSLLATSTVARPSLAQVDPTVDTYRQHMDVGIQLYDQKNYSAAIAEFEEAYKAKPKANPLVNIALCHKATFAYPKAIRALTTALEKHADTMDEDDKKAAQTEIDEMRALLAYVSFKLTPAQAQVQVDGEPYPDATQGTAVPLSPGAHTIKVYADGYATIEQTVTVASGQRELEYSLRANMGHVSIKAAGRQQAIAIDQKALAYGEWQGLITPGPHVIELYIPGSATPPYRVRLDVEVGKRYEISPGKGGVPLTSGGPVTTRPPVTPTPPEKPVKGPFLLAAVSLFGPTEQPAAFNGVNVSPGVAVGLRAAYRVNTPVSFDAMFEYSNLLTEKLADQTVNYNLEQVRGGLNMRLQTPGKFLRFYGNFGGGIVYESLDFSYKGPDGQKNCLKLLADTNIIPTCNDVGGIDGYFLIEGGLELTFGSVLVGLALGSYVQSTRGFGAGTYRDWLPSLEGGLRVGYAWWGI